MRYLFLDSIDDERLIELSEMPVQEGIAVAIRSTGFDANEDEVLEIALVDFSGNELFSQRVKPQNMEEWQPSEASGGLSPADVQEMPELYQFEEELSALFGKANIVVAKHLPFVESIIEQSWVTLPGFEGFDVIEAFRETHCADDYHSSPASAASMEGIAGYYDLPGTSGSLADEARTILAAYRKIVGECAEKREQKGASYWQARDARLAEQAALDEKANAVVRKREKNLNRMNGMLWVASALIFVSLIIQLYQRGGDRGFMVACGAAAVFAIVRAVMNFRK